MSTPTILPPLPKALQQLIKNPPAISTSEIVSGLMAQGGPMPSLGAGMDRHQQYLDSLKAWISQLSSYLQLASITPASSDANVTIDGVPVTYGTPPINALQSTSDTKGDQLDVRMLGAKGDVATVADAVTSAGSPNASSATANFSGTDVGKIIIVAGAGTAGVAFQSTIKTVTDASHVVMNANAVLAVTGADMSFGTDDTAAIQAGFQKHNCLFPEGRYFCDAPITIQDLSFLYFEGRGRATEILPTTNFTTQNFINILGSSYIDLHDITIDGRYFPDISQEIIIGDGTVKNPIYGDIRIHHCRFFNCRPIVIGIGATTGHTATNISIDHNRFYNCSWGSFLPNTIDTGSTGTKMIYKINFNVFEFASTSPGGAANSGVAIFAGHGTQTGTEIIGNQIWNAPIDAVQVYGRPFSGEAVNVSGVQVKQNFIYHPGWAGIALYGGFNTACDSNTIIFPGQQLNAAFEKRCGVYVSNGVSGVSNQHNSNAHICDNTVIGDGAGTTINGIAESTGPGPGVVDSSGIIANNTVKGQSGPQINVYGGFAIQEYDPNGTNGWAFGKADPTKAAVNALENIQVQRATSSLFVEPSALAAQAAGNFLLAYALNTHFDGANWVSGFDGISSGFAVIALDYGAGQLRFYVAPSTGGGPQTVSPATMDASFDVAKFIAGVPHKVQLLGNTLVAGASSSFNPYVLQLIDANNSPGVNLFTGTPASPTLVASWASGGTFAFGAQGPGGALIGGFRQNGAFVLVEASLATLSSASELWIKGDPTTHTPMWSENGSAWAPFTGITDLGNSADVTATGVSAGQALIWNGSKVVGVTGTTHTVPLAKLTVGGSNGSLIFTDGILIGGSDPT